MTPPRPVEDYVLLVYKACNHYDPQGPCGICWQKGFLAYAAEQVAQARQERQDELLHEWSMALKAIVPKPNEWRQSYPFEEALREVVAQEREACAQIADAAYGTLTGRAIAAAIRART